MSLRAKIILYLAALHLALAGMAVALVRHRPLWLLAVEAALAVSAFLGYRLVRAFFLPLELIRTGAELMGERDFSSAFRPVGQPEMDALIAVYNRMVENLREERLRAAEQHHFLARVLEASPAGIVTLDFEGRVSQANPSAAAWLGRPAEEIAGRPLADLPSPLARAGAALSAGESRLVAAPSGRRFRVSRSHLFDRGFARGFLLVEEMTEELRASEKAAYGQLIRMMSHEVNNSVGAVGSLLDSFRAYGRALAAEDRRDFEGGIGVAATRLRNLGSFMNGFAEVVRLPPPDFRPVDLAALIGELLPLLRPELSRRRIACTVEAEPGLAPISMDRNQMEQVLVNVLKNAMESIGEDGRITIRLAAEGGRPVLAIADDGAGLSDEAERRLFTPFFTTKKDGRGLGLTLVREIVLQHGFEVSLAPGRKGGAELTLRFSRR